MQKGRHRGHGLLLYLFPQTELPTTRFRWRRQLYGAVLYSVHLNSTKPFGLKKENTFVFFVVLYIFGLIFIVKVLVIFSNTSS